MLWQLYKKTYLTHSYGLKQQRRHGEAGSAKVSDVCAERKRMRRIAARFRKVDRFNVDETAFFTTAPPDSGLSTEKMSGKKKNKFRITAMFGSNEDGSEKLPIFFIGKSKKPRCFKNRTPEALGVQYSSNKKAWMTKVLFEP